MVGIKDRRIPDSAMTASSYYAIGYQAYYGRLDNTGEPRGFWHPSGYQRKFYFALNKRFPIFFSLVPFEQFLNLRV